MLLLSTGQKSACTKFHQIDNEKRPSSDPPIVSEKPTCRYKCPVSLVTSGLPTIRPAMVWVSKTALLFDSRTPCVPIFVRSASHYKSLHGQSRCTATNFASMGIESYNSNGLHPLKWTPPRVFSIARTDKGPEWSQAPLILRWALSIPNM
jgi:hypothetical protein